MVLRNVADVRFQKLRPLDCNQQFISFLDFFIIPNAMNLRMRLWTWRQECPGERSPSHAQPRSSLRRRVMTTAKVSQLEE